MGGGHPGRNAVNVGGVQRGVKWGLVGPEVKYLSQGGFERREEGVRGVTMRNGFIPHPIFLIGEVQQHFSCRHQHIDGPSGGIYRTRRGVKGDITHPERVVVLWVVGVFAGSKEVEKPDDQEVAACACEVTKL
jgi:hypothetical protein